MKRSLTPRCITAFALLFLYLPIFILIGSSFNASAFGGNWEGFTLKWYFQLWHNRAIWHALLNSLWVGLGATALSTLLGTLAALALHRYRTVIQKLHQGLIYAPLMIPDILVALSLLTLFIFLGWNLGLTTLFIAHTTFCVSYVTMVVLTRLQQFDPSTIEAAQDLGASWWRVQTSVVLPQIMPSIFTGALLAFSMSFDDFVISYFVTGPGSATLPVYIYSMIRYGATPIVNALCSCILALTITLFFITQHLYKRIRS